MKWKSDADFCIKIDFKRDYLGRPARVFEAMSGLIGAFEALDLSLAEAIDAQLRTELVLSDIQTGSLLTWLRTVISDIDDAEIMEHGWRAIARTFMVKTKHRLLGVLHGRELNSSTVKQLQDDIQKMAQKTNVKRIPAYGNVKRKGLVDFYEKTSRAVAVLSEGDSAKYISPEEETAIPKKYVISEEIKDEILTKETSSTEYDLILPVKKPDYMGQSRWEFKYEGHTIEAGMQDMEWLDEFQAGRISLSPGDSLSAIVQFEIKEEHDAGDTLVHYNVLKVKQVIQGHKQSGLFEKGISHDNKDEAGSNQRS